jgi:hypothetical protein
LFQVISKDATDNLFFKWLHTWLKKKEESD